MTVVKRKRRNLVPAFLLLLAFLLGTACSGIGTGIRSHTSSSSWTFAVIADTQGDGSPQIDGKSCINDTVLRAIAEDISREKPDFVLVAGDLVNGWFRNGGTGYAIQYENWRKAMAPVYHAGIRVYPIRGNHDSGPERLALPPLPSHLEPPPDTPVALKKAFQNAFSESYIPKNGPVDEAGLTYSFPHKNAFIVGLDQFTGGQHKVNQAWLDGQLAGNGNRHIFIYGHEPAFGAGHPDNLAFFPEERDLFWNGIGKAGARIYFCGHDHFYNRALIPDQTGNPIRQIIAGTGGGPLKKWSGVYKDGDRVKGEYHDGNHHGYVLVTVDGPEVTVAWKSLEIPGTMNHWRISDIFTYSISDTKEK
ncbi:MAG TPA: metallophosphoesterase [Syntrophales bacterium]|jgi:hypothetical protein|nr:metallophosphoesterase [Syntrophales bacterium]